jgi:uncharacterized protein (TIGR00369 family)
MDHMDDPAFARFVERMGVARFLGYRLVSRTDNEAVLAAPVRPELLQVDGCVHGGMIATLADTAAVWLLYPDLPEDRTLTSIEFKLNFTCPARLEAGDLVARARLVKRGRTVALSDVEVSQGDQLVAKGLFTYLLFNR